MRRDLTTRSIILEMRDRFEIGRESKNKIKTSISLSKMINNFICGDSNVAMNVQQCKTSKSLA